MADRRFRMMSAQESGIGGFLLLFVVSIFINLGFVLWQIPEYWRVLSGSTLEVIGRIYSFYPFVVVEEFVFLLARGVAFVIGLVLIFRRDRRTPVFFIALLGAIFLLTLVDTYFGSRVYDAVHGYLVAHGLSTEAYDAGHDKARLQNLRGLAYSLIWILYWRSSERVRLTFSPGSGMKEIPTTS